MCFPRVMVAFITYTDGPVTYVGRKTCQKNRSFDKKKAVINKKRHKNCTITFFLSDFQS